MAKRRKKYNFKRRKTYGRRYAIKTYGKRRKKSLSGVTTIALASAIYGGLRQRVSSALKPYTSRIPAGELADEVGMGLLSWALYKGKVPLLNKVPILRRVGYSGLVIESARVGEYFADRFTGTANNNPNIGLNVTVM